MSNEIKQAIRQEFVRCASDPIYFMRKYCKIQHPQRGTIAFDLFPFQEKVLTLFRDNPYNVVLKSRQLGISTLASGYALWLMLFHRDKNVLCIATKQETAKNMVTKVRVMYDNLPSWLKIKSDENNKLTLRLTNGSQIKATAASSDAGRSEAVSLLIIDEAAFIDQIGEIWASAQQTLATGGGCIALSTPYGTGNWFHKTWVDAELGENNFLPIKLKWDVHPERDQAWRDRQDKLLGDPRIAAQECDCDFSTSGEGVFYELTREWYVKNQQLSPEIRRGNSKDLWVWEYPDYSKKYMVVADVARGDGKDYSAFHVIDIESNTQVAEYKGKIDTKDYGHLLIGIASEYNTALLIVENASIGWNTIQVILDNGYSNLYHTNKSGDPNSVSYFNPYEVNHKLVPGFTNSIKTRPVAISKLVSTFNEKSITIKSKRTLEEMKVFVWNNGKAEAQRGYNDDLVMALAISQYIRETALKQGIQGVESTKQMLNNVGVSRLGTTKYSNSTQNPYSIDNGVGGVENIDWLL